MEIQILKSKIHGATITECDIDYEGSCGISNDILEKANILPYQQIEIYNINNAFIIIDNLNTNDNYS